MHPTSLSSARRAGFMRKELHVRREPRRIAATYLKQRSSFIIAAVSLIAFLGGNMIGQHGWYAFWKSVFGHYDDRPIAFTGIVTPVEEVPDYARWQLGYGGDPEAATFRLVPRDLLTPLPPYVSDAQRLPQSMASATDIYSVGHMGSYATGAEGEGSHPGVDIRLPVGTPVRSIAAGIVDRVGEDRGGFGTFVVVRHPHMPDPDQSGNTTVLYSAYAHLSAALVAEGDIIQKGQRIALSGQSGFATGPHLHFQIDRNVLRDGTEILFHPYWPFTSEEAREANLTIVEAIDAGLHRERGEAATINPLIYVQAHLATGPAAVTARRSQSRERTIVTAVSLIAARDARRERRIALRAASDRVVQSSAAPAVVHRETIAAASAVVSHSLPDGAYDVAVTHDGTFSGRGWEVIHLQLTGRDGQPVSGDALRGELYMRTAYGVAEFRPQNLSALDFRADGSTDVQMLPRGQRTVVILVQPLGVLSQPMIYAR